MKIYRFYTINSTNDFAKTLIAEKEDCIIIAKKQTCGHGNKGRTFVSDEGGLYITILKFYKDFSANNLFKIMINSAVSVAETCKKFGIESEIKWPNDVLVKGKKICGILINNGVQNGKIDYTICGIGLNINNNLCGEIKNIATSFKKELNNPQNIEEIEEELILNLRKDFTFEDYKNYVKFLGEKVTIINGEERKIVTALDICSDGGLKIHDGQEKTLYANEISLRI